MEALPLITQGPPVKSEDQLAIETVGTDHAERLPLTDQDGVRLFEDQVLVEAATVALAVPGSPSGLGLSGLVGHGKLRACFWICDSSTAGPDQT